MSKVSRTIENLKKCKCVTCPSFTTICKLKAVPGDIKEMAGGLDKAKHFEGMFCAFEKSDCIHDHKGCKCHSCKIEEEYGLKEEYFCTGH